MEPTPRKAAAKAKADVAHDETLARNAAPEVGRVSEMLRRGEECGLVATFEDDARRQMAAQHVVLEATTYAAELATFTAAQTFTNEYTEIGGESDDAKLCLDSLLPSRPRVEPVKPAQIMQLSQLEDQLLMLPPAKTCKRPAR